MADGPLSGTQIIELAGIGPGPFAGMLLADMGATVVRVERPGSPDGGAVPGRGGPVVDPLLRSRRSVAVDLKDPRGRDLVLQLVAHSSVLLEGYRPGVTERLGLGPQVCLERNPQLVYGRMTGWGQQGPLAPRAGHDINYSGLSGALHTVGPADRPPPPPVNYVADFGGGGMLLALGVLAALYAVRGGGPGQVVDAAMVDGAALQTAMLHGLMAAGIWTDRRASNLLDGAAPFYRTYRTADDGFMAVGALEPQFYAELLTLLDLDPQQWPQHDAQRWPQQSAELAAIFASRTRAGWEEVFAGSDACVTPVLSLREAPTHDHAAARQAFMQVRDVVQPAPAPRFSRTPHARPAPPPQPGADTATVLAGLGYDDARLAALRDAGVIG